jgi:hypothetical protein
MEGIFDEKDGNNIFNSFLNTLVRLVYWHFPVIKKNNSIVKKDIRRITPHINY